MKQYISIDPELGISKEEFVQAWNESAYNTQATAELNKEKTRSFMSPEMVIALVSAGVAIPATIISTFLAEYLKKKFLDNPQPTTTITTIQTPEGEPLLVIKKETH
ncbi:MAG: hypothetical protein AAF655_09420 [Bacteroidota bacterium]